MGNKLCQCDFLFNENTETNLGNPQTTKTTNKNSSCLNNNSSKSSFNNAHQILQRNSSSSTHCQDSINVDKKVKEITIKNQASKIAKCYKHHNSLQKEKEKKKKESILLEYYPNSFKDPKTNYNIINPAVKTINTVFNQSSSIIPNSEALYKGEEELKQNVNRDINENALVDNNKANANPKNVESGFLYGDDCSFKGSVSDLRKNDFPHTDSKRMSSPEENKRYNNEEDNKYDSNKKNNNEKITKDDVMQLMGMFSGNNDDNDNESDNDNLSFE